MKNVDLRLMLFYLVFMIGMRANAQNSQYDVAAKIKYIQENDPNGYKKLVEDLNRNSYIYGRAADSLKNVAQKIVCEKTGDCGMIESWELMEPDTSKTVMPDSLKQNNNVRKITPELFAEVNLLLKAAEQKTKDKMAIGENLVNAEFARIFKDGEVLDSFNKSKDGKKRKKEKSR